MRRSRLLVPAAVLTLSVATLLIAGAGSHPPAAGPSGAATSTQPAATAWKGQLTGPAAGPAMELTAELKRGDVTSFTPAQVDAAYATVGQFLEKAATAGALVDPSHPVTPDLFGRVSAPYVTPLFADALTKIATAAAPGTDASAVSVLRSLYFWWDAADAANASELRLAQNPFGAFKLSKAAVKQVSSGALNGLLFDVNSDLTLNLVAADGSSNLLTLTRATQLILVPGSGAAAGWQVDAWDGKWTAVKPKGQTLPTVSDEAKAFNPAAGPGTGSGQPSAAPTGPPAGGPSPIGPPPVKP